MRRSLKIVIVTGIILVAGFILIPIVIKTKVRQQLSQLAPVLQISFKSIHTHLFSETISFDSLDVTVTPFLNQPEHNHHLHFSAVALKGIHFLKMLFAKKFAVDNLILSGGNVSLDSFLVEKTDSVQSVLSQRVNWPFKQVFIRNLVLEKTTTELHGEKMDQHLGDEELFIGDFFLANPGASPSFRAIHLKASDIGCQFHGYQLHLPRCEMWSDKKILEADSLKLIFPQGKAFIATIRVSGFDVMASIRQKAPIVETFTLKGTELFSDEGHLEIPEINFNKQTQKMILSNIMIRPASSAKKETYQSDRIEGRVSAIEILKPDLARLTDQKFFAEKILVNGAAIHVFRDRRLPRRNQIIPLPMDYLKQIPVDIRVQSCEVLHTTVEYEEYPKSGYGNTGTLSLVNVNLSMIPFINHPITSDPKFMTMNVEASIMASGTARCKVLMPFQKDSMYKISGQIVRLELTKLNSSSENLGKIKIKSGFLDFLSFDFNMNEQNSTGKIVGAYHDLVIQPFKKHKDDKNVADFASFMLRHFIIPPTKDASLPEKKRTGLVDYKRDPTRMVSYYFLQSLLMGIKKSFTLGFLLPK